MGVSITACSRALQAVISSPAGLVCQRIVAAAVGGYVLAVMASIVVAEGLPTAQFDAVMAGVLLSFLFHLGIILWVFAVRCIRWMWLGLLVAMMVAGAAILLLRWSVS